MLAQTTFLLVVLLLPPNYLSTDIVGLVDLPTPFRGSLLILMVINLIAAWFVDLLATALWSCIQGRRLGRKTLL